MLLLERRYNFSNSVLINYGQVAQTKNVLTIRLPLAYQTYYIAIAGDNYAYESNGYPGVWVSSLEDKTLSIFKICNFHTMNSLNKAAWITIGF